jgi:hypothetical protein
MKVDKNGGGFGRLTAFSCIAFFAFSIGVHAYDMELRDIQTPAKTPPEILSLPNGLPRFATPVSWEVLLQAPAAEPLCLLLFTSNADKVWVVYLQA